RHIDEIALGRMSVLPIDGIAGRIYKTFELAKGLCQHRGVVFLVDDPIVPRVALQQRSCEAVVPEASPALPADGLGYAAVVLTGDPPLEAGNDVRVAGLAELHHDPAPAHFMRNRAGGARAGKGVKD